MQAGDAATVAAVTKALSGNSELRRLKVSVEGTEVTLTGRLPTLWHKLDAVKRALKVEGIKTVRLDVELPRQESDADLALFLGPAIDRYPYYTMFDYIDAVIRNGTVTLTGWVLPQGKKAQELEEEVAKVRGVQEIRNQIVTLTPSQNDDSIREDLFDRISSSEYFEQFANVEEPAVPHRRAERQRDAVRTGAGRGRTTATGDVRALYQRRPQGRQQASDRHPAEAEEVDYFSGE